MRITIPDFRAPSRNTTNRKHWSAYSSQLKEIASLIGGYATDRKLISPAKVVITASYATKKSVDVSNIDDKIVVDALMTIGILKNDNPIENPEVVKRVLINTGKNELVVDVIQL